VRRSLLSAPDEVPREVGRYLLRPKGSCQQQALHSSLADTAGNGIRDLDPTANYEQSWNDLRRRGRLVWLIAASFVPGVLVLIAVESVLFDDVPEHFGRWVGSGWLAAFYMATVYRRGFRCPRCHHLFICAKLVRERLLLQSLRTALVDLR
jgi:hypothetical protein